MSFKDILMLNAKDYFDTVFDIYVNLILLIIAISLCAASFVINNHKTYTVNLIKQLLRRGAHSEDSALTLSELHVSESYSLKRALMRDGRLTDIVKRAGETKLTYEEYRALEKEKRLPSEKIDFNAARFYIPKEKTDSAKHINERERPSIIKTLLTCVFIFALTVCIALLMPEALTLISNGLK